jgi:hypothetical protein
MLYWFLLLPLFECFTVAIMTLGIFVSHDHGYVRFVVVTIPFRDFCLIRAIQWASRMEQKLVTLPEHLLTSLKYS